MQFFLKKNEWAQIHYYFFIYTIQNNMSENMEPEFV